MKMNWISCFESVHLATAATPGQKGTIKGNLISVFKNIFRVRKWAGNCVTKVSQHKSLSGLTFARQKLYPCVHLSTSPHAKPTVEPWLLTWRNPFSRYCFLQSTKRICSKAVWQFVVSPSDRKFTQTPAPQIRLRTCTTASCSDCCKD